MFNIELKTKVPLNEIEPRITTNKKYNDILEDGRAIIEDICEYFEDTKKVLFQIYGLDNIKWKVDCHFDLVVVIEQLPEIISKIRKGNYNFKLDFYEQGIERLLVFSNNNNANEVILKDINKVNKNEIKETYIKKEKIFEIFNNLYNNFLLYSEVLCSDLSNNKLLKSWMKII